MKLSEIAADQTNRYPFTQPDIYISGTNIDSLKGCPIKVEGTLDCSSNDLTSLKFCAKEVGRDFNCRFNLLTSLEGGPIKVGGSYDCSHNHLESLGSIQDVIAGNFNCSKNITLKSLIGGPKEVTGTYKCHGNKFSSLEGVASIIGDHLDCCDNENLKSFHLIHKHIKHVKKFYAPHHGESAYSHVLGLLLIDGLTKIVIGCGRIEDCLMKHLANPNKKQRMLLAQQELIEMGFDKAAQL